ncbi:hypothetical protein ANN_08369 [Periplaneta americana]|uniref:Uncharacterized protein n=1 Tax=Periplaneta americana TaxID=6978 RepID=A0ABQ8T184_PERAM|nr:hypothetical protein ANN_08369 [Periplaneta americana]
MCLAAEHRGYSVNRSRYRKPTVQAPYNSVRNIVDMDVTLTLNNSSFVTVYTGLWSQRQTEIYSKDLFWRRTKSSLEDGFLLRYLTTLYQLRGYLASVDGIGDSEMIFGKIRPRIRHRLPDICLTVGENLGKNPTRPDPEWFKCFKNDRTSVDDDRSGQPSTDITPENVAAVQAVIMQECRQTIHNVCDIVGLSYGTCQRSLSDELNMRRIAAKFVRDY